MNDDDDAAPALKRLRPSPRPSADDQWLRDALSGFCRHNQCVLGQSCVRGDPQLSTLNRVSSVTRTTDAAI
jgi:hypothetical protein